MSTSPQYNTLFSAPAYARRTTTFPFYLFPNPFSSIDGKTGSDNALPVVSSSNPLTDIATRMSKKFMFNTKTPRKSTPDPSRARSYSEDDLPPPTSCSHSPASLQAIWVERRIELQSYQHRDTHPAAVMLVYYDESTLPSSPATRARFVVNVSSARVTCTPVIYPAPSPTATVLPATHTGTIFVTDVSSLPPTPFCVLVTYSATTSSIPQDNSVATHPNLTATTTSAGKIQVAFMTVTAMVTFLDNIVAVNVRQSVTHFVGTAVTNFGGRRGGDVATWERDVEMKFGGGEREGEGDEEGEEEGEEEEGEVTESAEVTKAWTTLETHLISLLASLLAATVFSPIDLGAFYVKLAGVWGVCWGVVYALSNEAKGDQQGDQDRASIFARSASQQPAAASSPNAALPTPPLTAPFKPLFGSTSVQSSHGTGTPKTHWSKPDTSAFSLRTTGYATHKNKEPASFEIYEPVGFDMIESNQVVGDVGGKVVFERGGGECKGADAKTKERRQDLRSAAKTFVRAAAPFVPLSLPLSTPQADPSLPLFVAGPRLPIPSVFIVNVQIAREKPSLLYPTTDGKGYNMCCYFRPSARTLDVLSRLGTGARQKEEDVDAAKAVRLWMEWCRTADTDPTMKSRFKMVSQAENLVEAGFPSAFAGWNGKPLLIKRAGTIHEGVAEGGGDYLEFDVCMHKFPYIAKNAIALLQSDFFPQLIVDIGFVIEGRTDSTLPEALIGGIRLLKPRVCDAVKEEVWRAGPL